MVCMYVGIYGMYAGIDGMYVCRYRWYVRMQVYMVCMYLGIDDM